MSVVSDQVGRLTQAEVEAGVTFDAPEATVRAILTQLDAIVDILKQLKEDDYEPAAGVDAAIDALTKLQLRR